MLLPYLINPEENSVKDAMNNLISLIRYFAAVVEDGDYRNDWLTHLPLEIVDATRTLGEWLAGTGLFG